MNTGLYSVSRNFSGWLTHSSGFSTWDMHHTWETTLASYTGRFSFNTSLYLINLRFPGIRFKCTPSWWSCELNQPKSCICSPESWMMWNKAITIRPAALGDWRNQQDKQFYSSQAQDMQLLPLYSCPRQPREPWPFQQKPRLAVEPRQNLCSGIGPQWTLGSSAGVWKSFRVTTQSELLCMTRPYTFALHVPFLKPVAAFSFQCL